MTALKVDIPRPAPCTVTLADPLPATFWRLVRLTVATSAEKINEIVPTWPVTETARLLVSETPCAPRHFKVVSDTQLLASQLDAPTRNNCLVQEELPKVRPCTVMLVEPVAG